MRTKHELDPCYVTVAGDVALVLVYPLGGALTKNRFHTNIIKLHKSIWTISRVVQQMLSLKNDVFYFVAL